MTKETLMEFPCSFPIKMMGHESPDFHRTVRQIVEKHTGPVDDDAIQSAQSRRGRFVSVTITILAKSQEQLDAIYRDATAHDDVLMAL